MTLCMEVAVFHCVHALKVYYMQKYFNLRRICLSLAIIGVKRNSYLNMFSHTEKIYFMNFLSYPDFHQDEKGSVPSSQY